MPSESCISADCSAISNDSSLPHLASDSVIPLNPCDGHKQAHLHTTTVTTITISNPTKVDDTLASRYSTLDLCTKPDSTTVASPSQLFDSSSVPICASSCIPSAASTICEDWIFQSLPNGDILAPTAPDLSFSFTPSCNQEVVLPGPHTPVSAHYNEHQETNLIGLNANQNFIKPLQSKFNSKIIRPTTADSSLRSSSNNFQLKSSSISSVQSGGSENNTRLSFIGGSHMLHRVKSNYRFLSPGHNSSKFRNSSYLESQLDFLTQHPSSTYHCKHGESIKMAQHPVEQQPQQPAYEPSKVFPMDPRASLASRKQAQNRMSTFLRLGNKPSNNIVQNKPQDDRQRRLSASNLLDKVNLLLHNPICRNDSPRSNSDDHIDQLPKAWLDPTISPNDTSSSPSASHVKSSRSLFNLFSSKFS